MSENENQTSKSKKKANRKNAQKSNPQPSEVPNTNEFETREGTNQNDQAVVEQEKRHEENKQEDNIEGQNQDKQEQNPQEADKTEKHAQEEGTNSNDQAVVEPEKIPEENKEQINIEGENQDKQEQNQQEADKTETLAQEERPEKTEVAPEPARDTSVPAENRSNQSQAKEQQPEESKGEEIQGEVLRPNADDDDDIERDDEEEGYDDEEYGDMDKLEIPKVEKEKGREAFSKGNYEEATKHFAKAILAVNFLFKDQRVPTEEKAVELLKDIQIPSYLNTSLCYIKLKSWKMAFDNASTVLTLDEDNVKALYRKAVAAYNLGELEIAGDCLKRALELEPNNNEIRSLAQELRQKKKQLQEKEKKIGQQMLQELSKAREEEQDNKKPKRKTEALEAKTVGRITALKDKVMEPLITKKEEVTQKVKTWRDQLKLLILLPLSLMSELCCKRRLPAQFYKLDQAKKTE